MAITLAVAAVSAIAAHSSGTSLSNAASRRDPILLGPRGVGNSLAPHREQAMAFSHEAPVPPRPHARSDAVIRLTVCQRLFQIA
jgi:hypothetical protein